MAFLIVSPGIDWPFASAIALRRRGLFPGSPPPMRAATVISLISFVKSLPRLASSAPFLCLIVAHLEWPLIGVLLQRVREKAPSTPAAEQVVGSTPRVRSRDSESRARGRARQEVLGRERVRSRYAASSRGDGGGGRSCHRPRSHPGGVDRHPRVERGGEPARA